MTQKTTEDLRRRLWDTLDGLRAGTTTTKTAMAVCRVSTEIVKTAELELRTAKLRAELIGKYGATFVEISNIELLPEQPLENEDA